jgi:hypothetical protein
MIKSWRNIILVFVFAFVFQAFDGFSACSSEQAIKPVVFSGMQTEQNETQSFSFHYDGCEDEQMQHEISGFLFVESVVLIKTPQIADIKFRSNLIPWEPPKE